MLECKEKGLAWKWGRLGGPQAWLGRLGGGRVGHKAWLSLQLGLHGLEWEVELSVELYVAGEEVNKEKDTPFFFHALKVTVTNME